jgi:hypothetical protein
LIASFEAASATVPAKKRVIPRTAATVYLFFMG